MRAIPQNLGAGTLRIVASVTIPFAVCLAVDTSGASAHYSCAYSTGSSVNEHNWQSQIPVGPVNAVESPFPELLVLPLQTSSSYSQALRSLRLLWRVTLECLDKRFMTGRAGGE